MAEMECAICGRIFRAWTANSRYCSDECRSIARARWKQEYRLKKFFNKEKKNDEKADLPGMRRGV